MTHVSPTRALRSVVALLLAHLVLPGSAFAAPPSAFEVGVSEREAGHLRGLVEKLAKQNVLYQFHLGGVTKQDMQETTAEIDRVIETLEKGSAAYSVAPPMNQQIKDQLREVDRHWGVVRRMALASPYDYLRFSSDLLPKRSRMGDPLWLRGFDSRAGDVIAESDKLMRLYQVECEKAQGRFCEASSQSGFFNMRIERIAKQLVLMYAGHDVELNREDMRKNRDELDAGIVGLAENPVLTQAMDPSRGRPAEFVSGLWASIQEGWAKLRFEADLAIDGQIAGLDIPRMLRAQRELVDDLDRIRGALSRYAQAAPEG